MSHHTEHATSRPIVLFIKIKVISRSRLGSGRSPDLERGEGKYKLANLLVADISSGAVDAPVWYPNDIII